MKKMFKVVTSSYAYVVADDEKEAIDVADSLFIDELGGSSDYFVFEHKAEHILSADDIDATEILLNKNIEGSHTVAEAFEEFCK